MSAQSPAPLRTILSLCALALCGCSSGGVSSAGLPTWTADPAQTAKLEAAVPLADGYQLRVPPGMDLNDESAGGNCSKNWEDVPTKFNPGQLRVLRVAIRKEPKTLEEADLHEGIATWQKTMRKSTTAQNVFFEPTDAGLINGIPFVRCQARGRIKNSYAPEGLYLGACYLAYHQGQSLMIQIGTGGKDTESVYKELQAAVMSLTGPAAK